MKAREQKVSTATRVLSLNADTLQAFGTPLCMKLMKTAGEQLLKAMEDTPQQDSSTKKST